MDLRRRALIGSASALAASAAGCSAGLRPAPEAPAGTLRLAFNFAETGFDPPRVGDVVSFTVNAHIFEPPLTYDPLARPVVLRPLTAAALPEVSADFRRLVVSVRPGIFFADDPVFQGRPRELVAADYVYSIKRFYDPAIPTEHLYQFEGAGILGLSELRRRAIRDKTPFDYDTPAAGLRALDRYRFEIVLAEPAPRFMHQLATPQCGAVAREVVDAYAGDPLAHPVGTGPFRLAQWRRGSRIVLERNPRYREHRFDSVAPPHGDAATQDYARHMAGRTLPALDRVEISIIEESQPRWLAFLGGEHDLLALPPEFAPVAAPGGAVAPHLARRGVRLQRTVGPTVTHTYFNFDDPVVGGYTPERVALRRAVALAFDVQTEVRLLMRGQAVPAQSMIPPETYGHDPTLNTEIGDVDPARAKALLDVAGFLDRDGDGWREQPDGSPLVLRLASTTDQRARQANELWRKGMSAVGLRIRFEPAPFAELIKRALAGQHMMWGFSWTAQQPDADFFLGLAYGPNAEQSNDARFRLPAFDRLYERQRAMPDGAERLAVMREAQRLMLAYLPYLPHYHVVQNDLLHARVLAPPRHPYTRDAWRYTAVG